MARLVNLKAARSLADVAKVLNYKPKALAYLIYKQPAATKYRAFQIPKRNGGGRSINAPEPALKALQRKVSDLLQDCLDEIEAARKVKDETANGFKRGRSIIDNALHHRNRRWIFNIDLEDFFPSINFGRVRGFFIKNRDFALHEGVATVLAQIACHQNALPQGSPCSPVISNLVTHPLDMRLVELASRTGCRYSRYADDITFSTSARNFPPGIARRMAAPENGIQAWTTGRALTRIIRRSDFRANEKKTHMMYRGSRQAVTGLVVNDRINVRCEYRHDVRAMVHRLVSTGTFEVVGKVTKDGKSVMEKRTGTLNELHGMLGFVDFIDRDQSGKGPGRESASEATYRRFLLYSHFYAAPEPVVVCEGPTDNVYLTHAIRSLAQNFPTLAEIGQDKKIRLKVRLYKYPYSRTARLLRLGDGGSDPLGQFIKTYCDAIDRFRAPGPANPVVLLYDNDSGAPKVRGPIFGRTGAKVTGTEEFVRVHKNLYAVSTPGADSEIEDFFDRGFKDAPVHGKTFSAEKDIDTQKHYGKKVFAQRVRQHADKVDFSGFAPLLDRLSKAIQHYAGLPPF